MKSHLSSSKLLCSSQGKCDHSLYAMVEFYPQTLMIAVSCFIDSISKQKVIVIERLPSNCTSNLKLNTLFFLCRMQKKPGRAQRGWRGGERGEGREKKEAGEGREERSGGRKEEKGKAREGGRRKQKKGQKEGRGVSLHANMFT